MKYTFSAILVLLLSYSLLGQEADSSVAITPKQKPDWKPSMINVGLDASRLAGSIIKDYKSSFGGMVEFDTHKFFVVLEGGTASHDRVDQYNYKNTGSFIKTGIDFNILAHDPDKNMIAVGARYARSSFTDRLSFSQDHYWFGEQTLFYRNESVKAQWFEAIGRINIPIWSQLYFGATIRVMLFKNLVGQDNLIPYDIPGWGRHRKNGTDVKTSNAGFTYYFIWRIPFRDKQLPVKKG